MDWLNTIGKILLYLPFLIFLFVYALTHKAKKRKALGIAADVTTFLLFFSIPASIVLLFGIQTQPTIFLFALLFAIFLLIREWKTTKEIEIIKFFRKLWRIYFLALAAIYAITWLLGTAFLMIQTFR
ncbi:DUF3397 family protein [Planococcus sp. ISL-109]|uniref:DUF3397 family protein n=1 Tax=Planococcus sp. ISL-109 TaxID=2819166 RepID=UPI001BE8CB23|nr:DUF3397 family protein [Planococcus sp. ISL-109]MBT2581849.1 DUF3397 family protein [Planococcus sp. ISL-109]